MLKNLETGGKGLTTMPQGGSFYETENDQSRRRSSRIRKNQKK